MTGPGDDEYYPDEHMCTDYELCAACYRCGGCCDCEDGPYVATVLIGEQP